jgi:TfoX/Sxy family transcriptional regulator of competence genes
MAYDEGLAERIRTALEGTAHISEKRMFGGLCFLVDGKMVCGIVKDELMVRVGAARQPEALNAPHVRPMDFTGKPLKGFVYVMPEGLDADAALERWVREGLSFARAAEPSRKRAPKRPASRRR